MASKKKKQANNVDEQKNAGGAPAVGDPLIPTGPLRPAAAANPPVQAAGLPLPPAADGNDVAEAADQPAALALDDAETRSHRAFFGRSGHLAVMAEFLHRRINVAIPEVDVGDDVFVVKGSDEAVVRVQVKSATAEEQQNSHVATVNVPESQLSVPNDSPRLVYIFAVRRGNRWSDFIVIPRSALYAMRTQGAGSRLIDKHGKVNIQFRIVFKPATDAAPATAWCGPNEAANFQAYRDAWEPWPPSHTQGVFDAAAGAQPER